MQHTVFLVSLFLCGPALIAIRLSLGAKESYWSNPPIRKLATGLNTEWSLTFLGLFGSSFMSALSDCERLFVLMGPGSVGSASVDSNTSSSSSSNLTMGDSASRAKEVQFYIQMHRKWASKNESKSGTFQLILKFHFLPFWGGGAPSLIFFQFFTPEESENQVSLMKTAISMPH